MIKSIFIYIVFFIMLIVIAPVVFFRYFYYVYLKKDRNYTKIYKLTYIVFLVIVKLSGVNIVVNGFENTTDLKKGFLIVSNHQSYFDIPILFIVFKKIGISFIAKDSIKKVPVLGRYMTVMNCIFLDRNSPRSGMEMIKNGSKYLKNGVNLTIFPEGTRSINGEMQSFKVGGLKVGTRVEADILPVSISGSFNLMPTDLIIRGGTVVITIHPKVNSKDYSDLKVQELSDKIECIVKSEVKI